MIRQMRPGAVHVSRWLNSRIIPFHQGASFSSGPQPRLLMQPDHHALVGHHQHALRRRQFVRPFGQQFFSERTDLFAPDAEFGELFGINRDSAVFRATTKHEWH